jgi:hypothetical protein
MQMVAQAYFYNSASLPSKINDFITPFQGLTLPDLTFFIELHPMLCYAALSGLLESTLHYKY